MDKKKAINRNFGVFLAVSIVLTVLGLLFILSASGQRSAYDLFNYVDNTLKLTGEILLGIGIVAIAGSIFYRYVAISKLEGRPLFQAKEATPVKEESNPAEELRKLKALYEEKAITKEEYDEQRKKVLERM